MNHFRPTLISAAVGFVLATSAVNASPFNGNGTSLNNANAVVSLSQSGLNSYDAAAQQSMASKQTLSGMKSYFDKDLGKATVLWATEDLSKPNMANIAKEDQAAFAANHYMSMVTGLSADKGSAVKAEMAYMHDIKRGAMIAKYKERAFGIEVFNREFNVAMDREYNLIATSGYFSQSRISDSDFGLLGGFGNPEFAIQKAVSNLTQGNSSVSLSSKEIKGEYEWFEGSDSNRKVAFDALRAKEVLFDDKSGLRAAYYVEIGMAEAGSVDNQYYGYVIDALNGKVLFKNNMVQQESPITYRAYLNDNGYPLESPHGDVVPTSIQGQDPSEILPAPLVTISSFAEFSMQDPWLSATATTTDGNNAFAYADVVPPQGFSDGDISVPMTSDGVFDYQLTNDEVTTTPNNINAAIVNLFVMNNFLHDYYYDFGFDEASGNAQQDNFGRGGVDGDQLFVEAQDFSGLNNANMATPADGANPRMQQFLWNSKDALDGVDFGVIVTAPDIGTLPSATASFGATQYDVTADVVRIIDEGGDGTVNDGCEVAVNADALAGNIAIIDRGQCPFTQKALNAQAAGAVGAIIVNNIDDGTPAPVGGTDAAVTIPTRGLNFQNGGLIYDVIDGGDVATTRIFENFLLKDSTFDNGIIAHEFGHYIQNRLVGNASGLGNFQGRAMGEGWADFHGLLFIALESDAQIPGNEQFQTNYASGTFVEDFFTGIRRAAYSTDRAINPLTFTNIQSGSVPPGLPPTNVGSPHAPGELWAVSLWDIYVGLINTHGFEEAQDRMSGYVIAGLKLTPINPLYTEARDAFLVAVLGESQEDFDLAVQAFAARGLGFGAVSPPRFSTDLIGAVESFETELASFATNSLSLQADFVGDAGGFCTSDGILDVGETGAVNFNMTNNGSESLSGLTAQLIVVGADGEPLADQSVVTFENDGVVELPALEPFTQANVGPIEVTLNQAQAAEALNLRVVFNEAVEGDDIVESPDLNLSVFVNIDFSLAELDGVEASDNMESITLFEDWQQNILVGGERAEETQTTDSNNTAFFQARNPDVDLGTQTQLFNNNTFESDVSFETRSFTVAEDGEFSVDFWHFYGIELGFDGGVVEVSIDGGDWTDVTEAGGVFEVGYPDADTTISDVLQGRPAFTGQNAAPGFPVGETGNTESINFGDTLNGSDVRFRFRMITDAAVGSFGWFVDNVTFNNISSQVFSDIIAGDDASVVCDITPLNIILDNTELDVLERGTGEFTATLMGVDDSLLDGITFSWEQVEGPDVLSLTGADTDSISFIPPIVSEDTDVAFELTVTGDNNSATVTARATIINTVIPADPPPAEPNVNDTGSGSAGWLSLLLLPLTFIRRRRK